MGHLGRTPGWEALVVIVVDSVEGVEAMGVVVLEAQEGDMGVQEGDFVGVTEAEEATLVVEVGGSEGDLEEVSGAAEGDFKEE